MAGHRRSVFSDMRFVTWIVIIISLKANAQGLLRGSVMDAATDSVLAGATIWNLSQHIYKKAGAGGQYSIIARATDSVAFSAVGYRTDTIVLSAELILQGADIGLKRLPGVLNPVFIYRPTYTADSMERRRQYRWLYAHPSPGIISPHGANDGFGLRFSPFTYWSKKERVKRRFKKQLAIQEEQAYVDYYFSPAYVHRVTGLSGDSLSTFMMRYRPTYQFVRSANAEDLFRYINDALLQLHQQKK